MRTYDKKVNQRLRSMGRSATPSVGMLAGLDRRARHDSEQLA